MLTRTTHETIPEDLQFQRTIHEERHLLETVQVPIVTVSATFKEELVEKFGEQPTESTPDVTFSRAHYSMANALVVAATKKSKTFWMVDPTNYVSARDWPKVLFTERMARLIARHPLLKEIKDSMNSRLRNQLPLTAAIREPLIYVTHRITRPIISLHYEAGNILVEQDKTVLQVVTDPHVWPQYLTHARNPRLSWAVFDEKTKGDLIELGFLLGSEIDESRVRVTGCPVDPRIAIRDRNRSATAFKRRPLRLAITTGGLGTNKPEIEEFIHSALPLLKRKMLQLACFAGVHHDFVDMFESIARDNHLKVGEPTDATATFRVFVGNDIIDANEALLDYGFPWADGFVTKPSGDMAYEAVTAGCFLLTLTPWAEAEQHIRAYFEQLGVSRRSVSKDVATQLLAITEHPIKDGKPWVQLALEQASRLQPTLSRGAFNILALHDQLARLKT